MSVVKSRPAYRKDHHGLAVYTLNRVKYPGKAAINKHCMQELSRDLIAVSEYESSLLSIEFGGGGSVAQAVVDSVKQRVNVGGRDSSSIKANDPCQVYHTSLTQ